MAANKAVSGPGIDGGQGMGGTEAVCTSLQGSEYLLPEGGNSPTAMASRKKNNENTE
jgi:hypothetical protein